MADDNILANLVGSIILQIKPYQAPTFSGNGNGTHENAAQAAKEGNAAPAAGDVPKVQAALPRNGIFRWLPLRRNGNGGEAAKKQAQPNAIKK